LIWARLTAPHAIRFAKCHNLFQSDGLEHDHRWRSTGPHQTDEPH
jgi:hypothetical protein